MILKFQTPAQKVIEKQTKKPCLCEYDLNIYEVTGWQLVEATNGNAGQLIVKFKSFYGQPVMGIHPPLDQLLNKDEIIAWLKKNRKDLQLKSA